MSEESFRMVIEDTFLVRGRGNCGIWKGRNQEMCEKTMKSPLLSHQMKPTHDNNYTGHCNASI